MEVIDAIKERKSIRGFKPEPVPQEILRNILEVATQAPSGTNCQPWELTVATGRLLDRIRQANVERLLAGELSQPDFGRVPLTGIYKERSHRLAAQLFGLLDIARHDRPKRDEWLQRGCRYFDAPATIFLCIDPEIGEARGLFDCGSLTQNICLAALPYGLGTCIQSQGVAYPYYVKSIAGIPLEKRLVTSIAIGYPDWDYPANHLVSEREPIDKLVCWVGFD